MLFETFRVIFLSSLHIFFKSLFLERLWSPFFILIIFFLAFGKFFKVFFEIFKGTTASFTPWNKVIIIFSDNKKFVANKLILATHADQALHLLDDPSKNEFTILSQFKYSKNQAYLHSDNIFMPKRKAVWSSWNFLVKKAMIFLFPLPYWLILLQI